MWGCGPTIDTTRELGDKLWGQRVGWAVRQTFSQLRGWVEGAD
jgi:hypothetical protein